MSTGARSGSTSNLIRLRGTGRFLGPFPLNRTQKASGSYETGPNLGRLGRTGASVCSGLKEPPSYSHIPDSGENRRLEKPLDAHDTGAKLLFRQTRRSMQLLNMMPKKWQIQESDGHAEMKDADERRWKGRRSHTQTKSRPAGMTKKAFGTKVAVRSDHGFVTQQRETEKRLCTMRKALGINRMESRNFLRRESMSNKQSV